MSSEAKLVQFENQYAIQVENLSKVYNIYRKPEDRLKQIVTPRLQKMLAMEPTQYFEPFPALSNISFAIPRGETVGIVGRNGSGKSTLLQIICGTLQASSGNISVNGRLAALLELGAGFSPDFSGRENVFLNATLLGLSKAEIEERFESIEQFAEIGSFIEQPVKTYSSGMYMRLAFAVAINSDPDILVVDEALSVGDEAFRRKCYSRIEEIQSRGATILFVSHGVGTVVQLCSHALLLDAGELIMQGQPRDVTAQYQRLINVPLNKTDPIRNEIKKIGKESGAKSGQSDTVQKTRHVPNTEVPGSNERFDSTLVSKSTVIYEPQGAEITDIKLLNSKGRVVNVIERGQRYKLLYSVTVNTSATNVGVGTLVKSFNGVELGGTSSNRHPSSTIKSVNSGDVIKVQLDFECSMNPGVYFLNAGVVGSIDGDERFLHRILDALIIRVAEITPQASTSFIDFDFNHHIRLN